MTPLNIGDSLTLTDGQQYLVVLEIPLDDKKYYALRRESDAALLIVSFDEGEKIDVVTDQATVERLQKVIAELPEE